MSNTFIGVYGSAFYLGPDVVKVPIKPTRHTIVWTQTDIHIIENGNTPGDNPITDITISPLTRKAVLGSEFGHTFLFNRVHIVPERLPIGFIIGSTSHTIRIWNAFLYKSVLLTAQESDFPTGTTIEDINFPASIGAFGQKNITIVVLADGPADQNTTYTFTINEKEYSVIVSGFRILVFDVDLDWDAGPELIMEFFTTVATASKLKEQRRAMSEEFWTGISGSFLVNNRKAQKIFNIMSFGKDKVFAVPIYFEKLTIAAFEELGIAVNEDLNDCFYTKNGMSSDREFYFMITDHQDKTELKKVSSIDLDRNEIFFQYQFREFFNPNSCFAYPVLLSTIKAMSFKQNTDMMDTWRIDWEEYKENG